jgi:hypothetical protein
VTSHQRAPLCAYCVHTQHLSQLAFPSASRHLFSATSIFHYLIASLNLYPSCSLELRHYLLCSSLFIGANGSTLFAQCDRNRSSLPVLSSYKVRHFFDPPLLSEKLLLKTTLYVIGTSCTKSEKLSLSKLQSARSAFR